MSALSEAFRSGRASRGSPPITPGGTPAVSAFQAGVSWVREVLSPVVDLANSELKPEDVALRLDVNLDPRSTNHAHADIRFFELGDGYRRTGAKYSLNVVDRKVWLYKEGVPGRMLGDIDACGTEAIEALMREAAKEFGTQVRLGIPSRRSNTRPVRTSPTVEMKLQGRRYGFYNEPGGRPQEP